MRKQHSDFVFMWSLTLAVSLVSLMTSPMVKGALIDLTSTIPGDTYERVIFSDDFNDNGSGWSDVGVVNGVGTAAPGDAEIGTDPLGSEESAWFASDISDATGVASTITLGTVPDISKGLFSIYTRVRIENDHVNSRFSSYAREQDSTANWAKYEVQPISANFLNYRQTDGGQAVYTAPNSGSMTVADGFVNFRFSFTDLGNGAIQLDGYYYDTSGAGEWVLAISSADEPDPMRYSTIGSGAGIFDFIQIANRKATAGGYRAVFDAIAVTVAPEPGTVSLVVLGGLAMLWRKRN